MKWKLMLIGYFALLNLSADGIKLFCFTWLIISIAWIIIMEIIPQIENKRTTIENKRVGIYQLEEFCEHYKLY